MTAITFAPLLSKPSAIARPMPADARTAPVHIYSTGRYQCILTRLTQSLFPAPVTRADFPVKSYFALILWACKPHPQYDFEFLEGALMESRHEDILSEIKLGDPQSTLVTARQCNIIPDLLKVPMKDEVSLI